MCCPRLSRGWGFSSFQLAIAVSGSEREGIEMHATVGDRLVVHGAVVGEHDKCGEIIEVRGVGGEPPFLVRFEDGHQALVFPGPDAVIVHEHRGS
ncbi:hypothetical protein GCM10023194_20780 [Planotetraspora phitsanulokensis]